MTDDFITIYALQNKKKYVSIFFYNIYNNLTYLFALAPLCRLSLRFALPLRSAASLCRFALPLRLFLFTVFIF